MNNSNFKKIILPLCFIILISVLLILVVNAIRKPQKFFVSEPDFTAPISFDSIIRIRTENVDLTKIGEIDAIFSPEIESNATILDGEIIIDHEIFVPGETYTLIVLSKTSQLISTSFHIKELNDFSDEELEKYSSLFLSANQPDENEWKTKLPYFADSYTIIYDYENKILRVRINNSQNLSPDALQSTQDDSIATIANLGIPSSEKVVFILD